MEPLRLIELIAAVLIVGVGIALYRRKPAKNEGAGHDGGYGSQGAVLLFVLAAIIGIHALGGLDYHPTDAERDYFRTHAR
jgi:prolipoprotein diacylglyceryltransferase